MVSPIHLIQCDLGTPTCLRCAKARIVCQGYGRKTIFVNRTLKEPSTTALSVVAQESEKDAETTSNPRIVWFDFIQHLKRDIKRSPSNPPAYRAHVLTLLDSLYLPQEHATTIVYDPENAGWYSWLHSVCTLKGESSSLDHALLAFCTIIVQVAEPENGNSEDDGLQLYNQAVRELIKDLGNDAIKCNDETLAAIVIVSTCEVWIVRLLGHLFADISRLALCLSR